uniref:Uncharacterized protein n=1 Tax=Arundo donax TaxID=35708 RepID=A0A0A9CWR8_ARUDO
MPQSGDTSIRIARFSQGRPRPLPPPRPQTAHQIRSLTSVAAAAAAATHTHHELGTRTTSSPRGIRRGWIEGKQLGIAGGEVIWVTKRD